MKTTIKKRALVARINRRLARTGERLYWEADSARPGDYMIVSRSNVSAVTHVDPVALAREIGCLRKDETVT